MENFEQPTQLSVEELMSEKTRIMNLIEMKREGRKAMEASGMTVEPESEDMDMKDLLAELEEVDVQLGNNPDEPRFPEMM